MFSFFKSAPMKIFTPGGKGLQLGIHVLAWVFLFIVPSYLLYLDSHDNLNIFAITTVQVTLYAIIFYTNYLWLIPAFFFRKKRILYFCLSALAIVLTIMIMEFTLDRVIPERRIKKLRTEAMDPPRGEPAPPPAEGFRQPLPPPGPGPGLRSRPVDRPPLEFRRSARPDGPKKVWPIYNYLITSIILTGFSIGLRYSDKVAQHEKQQKEAEKEKLNTELALLKNQINPHFFFNTLNNIYSLVQINVEDGQKAILQLSKLMRYLLYETEKGMVPLSMEIDFMKSYIDLMKLRLSGKVDLNIGFPENYPDPEIPPLIFLPFIENAFKHGISYKNPSFIHIGLAAGDTWIDFRCDNSIAANSDNLLKTESGIGLENVRKRLALLYPARHNLQISDAGAAFEVRLHIDL